MPKWSFSFFFVVSLAAVAVITVLVAFYFGDKGPSIVAVVVAYLAILLSYRTSELESVRNSPRLIVVVGQPGAVGGELVYPIFLFNIGGGVATDLVATSKGPNIVVDAMGPLLVPTTTQPRPSDNYPVFGHFTVPLEGVSEGNTVQLTYYNDLHDEEYRREALIVLDAKKIPRVRMKP
jgi:hypothetical protein